MQAKPGKQKRSVNGMPARMNRAPMSLSIVISSREGLPSPIAPSW